ncbi:serine hydrolase domain-containing protein [Streptomyces sp. G45]|uniref:serine hydrolase domain-containing protein n=1 Tax=Streptomyces sp. G45 TaxID=3406627 RepID=UPI003C13663A
MSRPMTFRPAGASTTALARTPVGRRALVRGAALLVPSLGGGAACASKAADRRKRRRGDGLRDRIHETVTAELPKGPGVTVLAARGSELLYGAGFGLADRAHRTRCARETVYDIASNTKQFTAAAVLKLEAQGRLGVDDRIGDLLPGLPPDKRPLTVHQLLTHTSGLPEFLPDRYGDDYAKLSRAQLVAATAHTRLHSRPGRTFRYSNLGYSLLAAIVEVRSGLSYERYLARHLLGPARLDRTGHVLPRWRTSDIAVEYDERGRPAGRPNTHPWAPDGPYWNLRGNGGLLSTAEDLFRWHLALRGDDVLPAAARRKLFARHVSEKGDEGPAYGYGWALGRGAGGHPVASHTGQSQIGGSYSEIARSVDGGAFACVATNFSTKKDGWELVDHGLARRLVDLIRTS